MLYLQQLRWWTSLAVHSLIFTLIQAGAIGSEWLDIANTLKVVKTVGLVADWQKQKHEAGAVDGKGPPSDGSGL